MSDVVHPYMPNSAPETRAAMLHAIGIASVDDLFKDIPDRLQLKRPLALPAPLVSEYDLEKHVREILAHNESCDDRMSFLGAGCYQHYVPAVVDAMIARGEFLTAYDGNAYSDGGRLQATFEYQSLLCDLLNMEVTGFPSACSLHASSTALRIASRVTGRHEVLVPTTMNPRRAQHLHAYRRAQEVATVTCVEADPATGLMDISDLRRKLTPKVAGVLVENPTYLGVIESQVREIGDVAHANGALLVACVNPLSLGVLASPGDYGADIACGDAQPLGVHMNYGGGALGFVAIKADYVMEFPNLMVNIAPTLDGEGFGFDFFALPERLTYFARESAKEYTGTMACLWAIASAVYLSLMGPQGMRDIGETIMKKSHYAKMLLAEIPGFELPLSAPHFNEFVVNFDGTGRTVAEVNAALLDRGIYGGADLSSDFHELGQSALYCVSEVHSASDLKLLATALKEVTR